MTFHVPNQFRIRKGFMASSEANGNNGAFFIPNKAAKPRGLSTRETSSVPLKVIASDGGIEDGSQAWEHVSISLPMRCPTWDEMCFIKSTFLGRRGLRDAVASATLAVGQQPQLLSAPLASGWCVHTASASTDGRRGIAGRHGLSAVTTQRGSGLPQPGPHI